MSSMKAASLKTRIRALEHDQDALTRRIGQLERTIFYLTEALKRTQRIVGLDIGAGEVPDENLHSR